jgi:hypothetical protein
MTPVIFGPALPTLDDVAAEFPWWHCWAGLVLYASLARSSPPLVVRAGTPLALREQIREAQAALR